jgi:GNAT superfamily N-acetyltransferase
MEFKIIPVTNKAEKLRFIKSQWNFYKDDRNFVPPIIADRQKLLDTEKNPFYQHSDMQLFFAESNSGEIVGRIAAIINHNHNTTHNDKVGFYGFFECIDNQDVANQLFDTAGNWLKARGMDSMRGPENPSQNDEIGLLTEGFDSPPVILMTYNPEYYIKLTEGYGFTKAKELYAYELMMESFVTDKLRRLHDIVTEREKVTLRNINFKNKEQFKKDVATIKDMYNKAWEPNWGFVKMTNEEFDFLADDLKQIADPAFAFIAEIKGKPAAFALALPDINQALIGNKKGSLLGALWCLITKKKKINCVRIIVLGVLPEFQKTGIDAVMYYAFLKRGPAKGIIRGEASWILEDNTMMNRGLTSTMNGRVYKKYRLYEKVFNSKYD